MTDKIYLTILIILLIIVGIGDGLLLKSFDKVKKILKLKK